MNCNEFQERLEQALDDHGPNADQSIPLRAHVQQCGNRDCADLWERQQLLTQATAAWRRAVPRVDLVDRVVGELCQGAEAPEQDSRPPARVEAKYGLVRIPSAPKPAREPVDSASTRHGWGAVVAGVAALALVAVLMGRPHETPTTARHDASESAANEESTQTGDSGESTTRAMMESYANIPVSATELVTDAVVMVVPADLTESDDEPSRVAVWADQLEEQWEPIGKELSSAFEVLLKVVPPASESST